MVPAGDALASAGVDPEVGGASIGDNGEGLGWGSNGNSGKVLGIHVVRDGNNSIVISDGILSKDSLLLLEEVSHGERLSLEGDLGGE